MIGPDAVVIALSPETLMDDKPFVCEICNAKFKREQNLELHKRSHNQPWKLKHDTRPVERRRKVYVCPVPDCVHHDPARALGDITAIKKHYGRKHGGQMKHQCEKCQKWYAVKSDYLQHKKICQTREYKCDCGTTFAR